MHKWVPMIATAILVSFGPDPGQRELHAENPLLALLPFRMIDADPNKSYTLTPENGPWVIVASSFAGNGAEQQARELVYEPGFSSNLLKNRYLLVFFVSQHLHWFSEVNKF